MKTHLLIVDPQNDFCIPDDGCGHQGALVVPGANQDMLRVAAMMRRIGDRLDSIHLTLDSHQTVGIERPRWWQRVSDNAHPEPFTILGIHPAGERIVKLDYSSGSPEPTDEEYTTTNPTMHRSGGPVVDPADPTGQKRLGSFGYLQQLAEKGRYPHVVWPEHCVIGTWGWSIVEDLAAALSDWEWQKMGRVNYVLKGNNPWTEHFSGLMAEVPHPDDPSTNLNRDLLTSLEQADIIALCGEALSHCVANTGRDLAAHFSDPGFIKKVVLLVDASSNVPSFDFLGDAFLEEMLAKGMQTSTTVDFLSQFT